MDEKLIKEICKWLVENGKRSLSREEKELIKRAIDHSHSLEDLSVIAINCYMAMQTTDFR